MDELLGKPVAYWLELDKQAHLTDKVSLLEQMAALRQRALLAEGLLREIQTLIGSMDARAR